jgi:hypothetical protein
MAVAPGDSYRNNMFDVVVAYRGGASEPWLEPLIARACGSGYQAIDGRRLPPGYNWTDLVLLVRRPMTKGVDQHKRGQAP